MSVMVRQAFGHAVQQRHLWPLRLRSLAALGLACAAWNACAQAPRLDNAADKLRTLYIDHERSSAEFELKVLWLLGVHGRFNNVRGTIVTSPARDSVIVDARIAVNEITMRNKSHEEWVKSAEFFDAQHYPQIEFVSDPTPPARLRSGGTITGTLTIRGVLRPVQFEVAAPDCQVVAGESCPVAASGSIHRSEFGMMSRRAALSDKVDLSFSIVTKTAPDAAP